MIKILILFAIVLLSGVLGLAISAEKKKKLKVIEQFCEFNERLIINLKYGREKVGKVAEDYNYVKKAMSGEGVLKGEEGEFLKNYLGCIGGSDSLTQIDYLSDRGEKLKQYRKKFDEDYKKYGSMYFKLCILAGLLIAVLLA